MSKLVHHEISLFNRYALISGLDAISKLWNSSLLDVRLLFLRCSVGTDFYHWVKFRVELLIFGRHMFPLIMVCLIICIVFFTLYVVTRFVLLFTDLFIHEGGDMLFELLRNLFLEDRIFAASIEEAIVKCWNDVLLRGCGLVRLKLIYHILTLILMVSSNLDIILIHRHLLLRVCLSGVLNFN